MARSKLAAAWSQTENCIDDGGFLPRLAWSLKIDYLKMVRGTDSDESSILFNMQKLENLLVLWVHFKPITIHISSFPVPAFTFCILCITVKVFANARQFSFCNFDWILLSLPKIVGMNFIIFIGE